MVAYHLLTTVNVSLMALLAYRTHQPFFRCYLIVMAIAAGLQNTTHWGMWGEVPLALFSALWLVSELTKGRRAVMEALSLGLMVSFAIVIAVPRPWPMYSHAMYFTRMYSSALCVGIATPLAVLDSKNALIILWFSAVLLSQSQRGWPVWIVAVVANATWTLVLIGWLAMSRRSDAYPASS